jgi:hypothetical protein
MKLTKQQTQFVLGGLLLALVVAFALTVPGMLGGNKPPAPATTGGKESGTAAVKPAAPAAAATLSEEPGNMDWVPTELSKLVDLVAVSRNPFQSLLPNPEADVTPPEQPVTPPNPTPPEQTPTGPTLPWFPTSPGTTPPAASTFTEKVRLEWASVSDLAAGLKRYGVSAKAAQSNPGWAVISGPSEAQPQAMETVRLLNTPPPIPDFELQGVVITPERTVAYIAYDGKTYAVKQGQAIPHVGWTVTAVSSNRVTVFDGRRSKEITLSGGGSR